MSLNNNKIDKSAASHTLHLAVLAALPLMALASFNASAACTGSIGSPVSSAITVQCNGTESAGNLTNMSTTSYHDTTTTATAGNNALLQFDGQGRVLINSGDIINDRVITGTAGARGRTAVFMGAATLNAGAGTVFAANLPTTGVSTVTLNAAPTAAYVGQTVVFGRYNAAEGDFAAGVTRIITAVDVPNKTITFSEALPANFAGSANSDPIGYKVVSNYGVTTTVDGETYHNVIINSGTISSKITAAEINAGKTGTAGAYAAVSSIAAVKAITMSVEGDYLINNASTGAIRVQHDGIGAAYAIEQGGAVESLVVNNAGTISAERTAALTLVSNTATANPTATAVISGNTFAAQTVALVNAINTQEEAEAFTLNNAGTVRATGDYASAIYMRAAEKTIINEGLIEYVGAKGFAIGAVSDPGSVRTLTLENTNTGVINGDILVTNGNALRWYLLSTEGALSGGKDSRLNINSQYGQSDSSINNAGVINGSLYFSNGTHELSNSHGATILGNIDLDQRNSYGVTGDGTLVGTKAFTFENAGTFTGNITVHTASSNVFGSNVTSDVTLVPTITGAGSTDVNAPNTANIRRFNGDLIVVSTAIAGGAIDDVTIAPKAASGTIIRDGQFYQVFNHVKTGATLAGVTQLTSADELPATSGNGLVGWTTHINSTGALVLESEVNAANVSGATASAKGALASLMAFDSNLGSSVQNLASNEEVRRAGEQLRPEANNASTQAVMSTVNQVSTVIGVHQDQVRVASKSGVSSGEVAQGLGFWMQGFGFKGEQNQRGGVDGYSASTGGFIFGADSAIGNGDLRLGAALAYGTTTVDGQGVTTANRTNINSYQATVYGSWDAGNWYADAALGYGQHQYNTKRYVALANANMSGDHDADQYSAKLGLGYPLALGRVIVTPLAAMSYVHLDQSGYTESDATNSGAALTIGNTKTDSLRSGLGAKVALPLSAGTVKTAVEARALWNHEFADTNQDIAARFAAGTSFTTNGVSQARDSANLGLGLNMNSDNGQTFSVNYDAEVRSSYTGHTASIKFRYNL